MISQYDAVRLIKDYPQFALSSGVEGCVVEIYNYPPKPLEYEVDFFSGYQKTLAVRTISANHVEKITGYSGFDSHQFIGRTLTITIDRPLGSHHPKHGFEYTVNYGYLPGVLSGDGEELDAYVLGINEPLKTFTGECIAVIHRFDDDDDKLVFVPSGTTLTDEKIRSLTHFQEQWFTSEIWR